VCSVRENVTATSDLFFMSRGKSCARLFQFHVSLASLRNMILQQRWVHVCLNIKWRLGSVWWRAAKWPVWIVRETHYMLLSISKLIEMKWDKACRMRNIPTWFKLTQCFASIRPMTLTVTIPPRHTHTYISQNNHTH
jgi:hypothetical protein